VKAEPTSCLYILLNRVYAQQEINFVIALAEQCGIAINGSKNALPKHSINFHGRHNMRIKVLDEIPYADFKELPIEKTVALARERIAAHVDEHRQAA
jgi:hypothetical protein